MLPAHCTAKNASQMTERNSDRGRDSGFVAHGAPKKTAASWNPRAGGPERRLARSSGWAIKSPCYRRRSWRKDGRTPGATQENEFGLVRRDHRSLVRSLEYSQSVPRKLACCPTPCLAHRVGRQAPITAHPFLSGATTPVPRSQPASGDEELPLHQHPGPVWPTAGLSRPNTPRTRFGRLTRPSGHPNAEWGPNLPPPAPPDLVAARFLFPATT